MSPPRAVFAAVLVTAAVLATQPAVAAKNPAAPATTTAVPAVVPSLPLAPAPLQGERILVVAPHPDDETLCCAGTIQQALAVGAQVSVVWITSGDAFELDAALVERTLLPGHHTMLKLAATRMREAQAAVARLGLDRDCCWFLGYPDRGIRRLMTDFYARPYRSHYTGRADVPYDGALSPGSAYEGRWLERDLQQVLDHVQPTRVLAPSPLDLHRDHAAVGDLVLRLMSARGQPERVQYWIVHAGRQWPAPRHYAPAASLEPPLRAGALQWRSRPLGVTDSERKLAALRLYRSQWEIMGSFLAAFARSNELFADDAYPAERSPPPFERDLASTDAANHPVATAPGADHAQP